MLLQSKWKEPAVSTLPWSANRRPSAAGLCVKGRKTQLLGYTGQNRKGIAHRTFVLSIRQLQMGLARQSLKASDASGVHMETRLSELLVQTLLLLSGERKLTRADSTPLPGWH